MTRKRRRFTADFKKRVALEALRERDTVQAIASRYEVHPNQVSAWKRQAVEGLGEVFSLPGSKRGGEHEATIRELHAKIGELTVGAGFFSARVGALSRPERAAMIDRCCALPLSRQCGLLGVSRSSQYYEPLGESAANLALMARLDELHLEHPFYGSRQMARHLRREGVVAGRHRVRRLMRLMDMEAIYRRPRTSTGNPEHRVYPYLLRDLAIDRPDQVWCADITYIPISGGFSTWWP